MKLLRDWRNKVYRAKSNDDYYESPEWRNLRRACLYRDGYRCLRCDKRFKTENLNSHHMMPRIEGGADDLTNLVTLCDYCHDFVEIADIRTKAGIVGSYEDNSSDKHEVQISPPSEIDTKRPEWHKFVYGGVKRRN